MNDLGYGLLLLAFYALALLPMRKFSYVLPNFLSDCVPCLPATGASSYARTFAASSPDRKRQPTAGISRRISTATFTDYIVGRRVELPHISDAEIKCRMQFENIELIDRSHRRRPQRGNIFSHCGTWEWATSMTLHVRHDADSQ